ncbi:hypothetical protein [Burkholderia gladioli]|uniref:hypothetical protein n=1 Tax=Burkholderia gladioli TaxID=28095 RepID=UPI00163E2B02|nr:hypothetical protein [Burkholderia gladioli]
MSDKLSDEQWSKLAEFDLLIDEYQGALLNGNHAERAVGRGQLKQVFREALLAASPAPAISESEDTKLLDFLAAESADLVSFAIPYEDDADIGWRVLQHHIGEAEPRVIGEVFKDDPRAAIDAARKGEKS